MKTKLFFLYSLLSLIAFSAPKQPVKIISVGSRLPKISELEDNITHYEKIAPFDGIMIHAGFSDVFRKTKFSDRDIASAQAVAGRYRDIPFKKWKYNFLGVLIDQHKPDWFDDDYWKAVAYNWSLAAKQAKNLKMVGICFDPEGYGVYPVNSYWKSAWWVKGGGNLKGGAVQPPDLQHTQEEYLKIARKRGRQVGEGIFKAYPEITLWGFYLWSFGVDMMGAFCNGILEVMPEKARLIDGDEWVSYCAKNEAAYERMERRNKSGCGMLDKKLSQKHNKQGGLAPAFYLDAYAWPDNSGCLTPTINNEKSKARFFRNNFKEAKRKASGGHIWIYGEKNTWFTPPPHKLAKGQKPTPSWEEVIPGISKEIFGDKIEEDKKQKKNRTRQQK
jgi:hypothetical protein